MFHAQAGQDDEGIRFETQNDVRTAGMVECDLIAKRMTEIGTTFEELRIHTASIVRHDISYSIRPYHPPGKVFGHVAG